MSLRLEMLQVARLSQVSLGDPACAKIAEFIAAQHHLDGGFRGRGDTSDLYYTSFGADALTALQLPLPETLKSYVERQQESFEKLDFVHLCCLARLTSLFPNLELPSGFHFHLEATYRSADGGYAQRADSKSGTAYAALLAHGTYSDHRLTLPAPEKLLAALNALRCPDGGYANDLDLPIGGSPPTAAAVTLLRHLDQPIPEGIPEFLLTCFHPESGGFKAFPQAPMPDLLSTAVTLHALDALQFPYPKLVEPILDFVDTLWLPRGAFVGSWADATPDLEYTYYGLLALGHLSL